MPWDISAEGTPQKLQLSKNALSYLLGSSVLGTTGLKKESSSLSLHD